MHVPPNPKDSQAIGPNPPQEPSGGLAAGRERGESSLGNGVSGLGVVDTIRFGFAPVPWSKRERIWLVILLLVAFGLRLWNVLSMADHPRYDAPVMDAGYHLQWAQAILAGESFQEGAYFRAPLYPWFVAGILKVTGGSLFAVRLVQCLLGVATTWLVLRMARRTFGSAAGWVSGVLAATYWIGIYFDGELLIPTLYVPLLGLALHGAMDLPRKAFAPRACVWTGIWFGLAAIARPNVLLFMPFLFVWLIWRARQLAAENHTEDEPTFKSPRPTWAAAALTVGTLIPVLPITVRNYVVSGEPVLVATQAGVNFWIGNNPKSDGMTAIVPGTRAGWWEGYEDSRRLASIEAERELTDAGISQHYADKAWSWILADPGSALKLGLWKARLFFMNWELSNNQEIRFMSHRFNPLSRMSISFGWLLGLSALGLLVGLRRRWVELFPLWGFLGVYSLSVIAFFVCSRFRVPVLPVLMVFAGAGGHSLWRLARGRDWRMLGVATLAVATVWFGSSRLPKGLLTGDSLGLLALGMDAMSREDLDLAERYFQEGLDLAEGNKLLRLQWANLLLERGQDDAGRIWMYQTIERYPDYPELRDTLSNLENDLGNYKEALALAQTGLKLAPSQIALIYTSGRALHGLGRKHGAIEQFARVLELKADHFTAHLSSGIVWLELGDTDKARAALLAADEFRANAAPEQVEQLNTLLQMMGFK